MFYFSVNSVYIYKVEKNNIQGKKERNNKWRGRRKKKEKMYLYNIFNHGYEINNFYIPKITPCTNEIHENIIE
jgi:hypothetical protein